jgi:transcriptional regulator with XRE-family HTH domain
MRDERKLTLREVGQLASMDHAYIHRLETGEREAPSRETVQKLERALKPQKREAHMLDFVREHTNTNPALIEFVRDDSDISFDEFVGMATMAHRGAARADFAKILSRVRQILSAEDDDG